jgi:formylglycine-generating enzyme required for sulfatase activity
MVEIPPGSFAMGSPPGERSRLTNEGPVHTVTIESPFYLGKYEVTQAQWRAVTGENPSFFSECGDDCPMEAVSWDDCQGFVSAINGLGLGTFRLPSEAEWEYACRADTTTRYFFGDSLACADNCSDCTAGVRPGNRTDYMWYCGNNTVYGTKSVGTKMANVFGLFDTHGNVYEWCQDWYHGTYDGAPDDGSAWEDPVGTVRVRRSGGWYYGANVARSAARDGLSPGTRSASVGFRLAGDFAGLPGRTGARGPW